MWCKIFVLLFCFEQDSLKVETNEVIISSTRLTAHSVGNKTNHQIDTSTLLLSRGTSVGDILMKNPLIFTGSTENFAQDLRISMRGYGMRSAFGIRGIKIVVDGIPESTPDGQGDVDNIESSNISDIKLLSGPANGIYSNATGGVIEMKTYLPTKPLEIISSTMGGSFGLLKQVLTIGSKLNRHLLSVSFSGISFNGYRQHSEHRNYNAQLKWISKVNSSISNQFIINGFMNPLSQDPGGLTSSQVTSDPGQARDQNIIFNAGEDMRQLKISNILQYDLNAKSQILMTLFGQNRDFENRLAFRAGGNVTFKRSIYGFQTTFKTRGLLSEDDLFQLGVEGDLQNDNRKRYDNVNGERGALTLDQAEKFSALGSFISYSLKIKDWDLFLNTRYEGIQIKMNDVFLGNGDQSGQIRYRPFTGSLKSGYQILPFWYINAGFVLGFETPTLTEVINNPEGKGFADLNPAQTKGAEFTSQFDWLRNNRIRINLFRYYSDNELLPYQVTGQTGRIFYRNGGESRRQGIEFESSTNILSNFNLIFSGTLANFELKNSNQAEGKRIPGIPETNLRLGGLFAPAKHFNLMADYIHSGNIMANDDNSVSVLPQNNIHIHAEYTFEKGRLNLTPSAGGRISVGDISYNNLLINAQGGRFYEPLSPSSMYVKLVIKWD